MFQVNCPKCNIILQLPETCIYECSCPRCGTQIRIRKGKTYEQNEIIDNLLYSITIIFAGIARFNSENSAIYSTLFDNFVKKQTLTKNQYNDMQKIFKNEQKGLFHENYKKIMKNLKEELDYTYRSSPMNEQQQTENSIFSLLFQMANATGTINEEQQKILNDFLTIFEFNNERKEEILNKYKPKEEKKNINIEDAFNKISNNLLSLFLHQESFIKDLMVAFKRPYFSPPSTNYKGATLILTNEDELVSDIIDKTVENMKNELIIFEGLSEIDCLEFNLDNAYSNFINTLSNELNSKNEIIILKNFKTLSKNCIELLSKLLSLGQLNINENLTLSCNNKFFILMTSGTTEEIFSIISEELSNSITDILKLQELTDEQLELIIKNYTNNFIIKLRNELQINLLYNPDILNYLKSIYNKNIGMKSIINYMEHNIHKPIIEYKLKKQPTPELEIILTLYENKPGLYQDGQIIPLEKLILKKTNANLNEIKEKLNKIIGLNTVKEYVLKLEDNVTAQKMREEAGLKTSGLSMNMIFTGNPGTGKTTIARIVAEYLKGLGVISKGQLVEVTRNDLVGEYQGETAQKASKLITSAIGGILFIDEAYSLQRGEGDSFGLEAIDILVKMMEDNKNDLVVILAGYSKEMTEFLKSNSGLKSRFPNIIDFPDYTSTEMYQIASKLAEANDYKIDDQCIEPLMSYFESKNFKGNNSAGNGRLARNTVEKAILNQSNRILKENDGDYETLKLIDFELNDTEKEKFNLEDNLAEIIGLDEVKNYIRALAAKIKVNRERQKLGLISNNTQTLHMIFKGNPGTGKTMMARTVANLLYNLNVINTNNLVETDRAGLVAGYVGQTAQKTTDKVLEAMNGVLFIDEAYTLSQGGENDFGREAIDTLVKLMDDNRDKLVVILAGYSDNMQQFLDVNPGLVSRFPNIVEFSDYTLEELLKITENIYKKNGYELTDTAYEKIKEILNEVRLNPKFGNGRYVRNIFEKSLTNQAFRVSILPELTKENLVTILPEDIEKI